MRHFRNFLRRTIYYLALATIGIIWAGLMMMHNKRVDYHEKGNNFLVAVLLFFGLTFLMTQGTKLITAGAEQAMVNTPSAVSIYQAISPTSICWIRPVEDEWW